MLRTDSDEPIVTKSMIDSAEPSLETDRTDMDEPKNE
jgi:hypothetical protein